jgi:uncharacterized protein (TIGR03503 family)
MIAFLSRCLLPLLMLATPMAMAADDIRILIDVSGSMIKTDPQNLRQPALRMLTGLIPAGSRAGVWTFGRYVNEEVKWGRVDAAWRKRADAGAAKIHSRGLYTNIEGAIKRALKGWSKPDGKTRRTLVLLTDGKLDISKKPEKNAASRERVMLDMADRLEELGIKVYAIALSKNADEVLLKRLALKTGGAFEVAESAEQLQRVFLRMFERATAPDTVAIEGNAFKIDASVREMTLLVFRKGERPTRLFDPAGQAHSERKPGKGVRWRRDMGYDLITVQKPMAGQWKLEAEIDPDNRVMVVTDLKLRVNDVPAFVMPDQSIDLQVELHNKGKKIDRNSFLKFVDFGLQHQIGDKRERLPLKRKKSRQIKDKGIYLARLEAPLEEGLHELVVTADARTFSRSRRISIEVAWPLQVDLEKTGRPGVYKLWIKPRTEMIDPQSLQLEVELENPSAQREALELKPMDGQWLAEVRADRADGMHRLWIVMKARDLEGGALEKTLEPYPLIGVRAEPEDAPPGQSQSTPEPVTEPEPEAAPAGEPEAAAPADEMPEEPDNSLLYVAIASFNLLLLAAGAALWWWLRQRKREKIQLLDADDDDPEVAIDD